MAPTSRPTAATSTYTGSRIEDNTAGNGGAATQTIGAGDRGGFGGAGGGVFARDDNADPIATVTISGSSVADNTAGDAGSSANDIAGVAGSGGGLDLNGARIVIERTSIVGNSGGAGAVGDLTSSGGGSGGGAQLRAGDVDDSIRIERSTIHANVGGAAAPGRNEGDGGGVFISAPSRSATFTHSTITANDGLNGVNVLTRAGTNTFRANVIGDTPNDQSESCNAIGVTTVSNGYNLEATDNGRGHTCQFDDVNDLLTDSTDLGALAANGGIGLSRAPLLGGALVDAVPCGSTTDQRGLVAPVGADCDIGAIELEAASIFLSDATVAESEGEVDVRISRTSGAGALAVEVTTVEGTAQEDRDFVATTETVTWPAGDETPRFVTVPIVSDNVVEDVETFTVTAAGETATVTIVDAVDLIVRPTPHDSSTPAPPARLSMIDSKPKENAVAGPSTSSTSPGAATCPQTPSAR